MNEAPQFGQEGVGRAVHSAREAPPFRPTGDTCGKGAVEAGAVEDDPPAGLLADELHAQVRGGWSMRTEVVLAWSTG